MRFRRIIVTIPVTILVVLSVTTAASASTEPGRIIGAGSPDAIAGSYVVLYRPDAVSVDGVTRLTDDLAARHRATVRHRYTSAVLGFAGAMSETAAHELAAHPAVDVVQQDAKVISAATQQPTPSWGIDRIDQVNLPLDNSFTYSNSASDVTAYVIDSGIRVTHSDFGGRAVWGVNTVGGTATDCNGHGTHMAGVIGGSAYGVAKAVRLVAVKVLDCAGAGSVAGVIAGVDWVTAQHAPNVPAVASLGLTTSLNPALTVAVRNSIADGVLYVAAAGNAAADACNYAPGATAEVLTVGAATSTDTVAAFSNTGTCVDLYAPGQGIAAPWHTNDTAVNIISGTSMAAAHAAGAAALYISANPGTGPATVIFEMVRTGTPIAGPIGQWINIHVPFYLLFCPELTNTTAFAIPDQGMAQSTIGYVQPWCLRGYFGWVHVNIQHTYIGDLVVDLVSPDGSVFNLHNRTGGSTDNLNRWYWPYLRSEPYNGVWILRVRDMAAGDVGTIISWTIDP